jgi:hypothetical protein
LSSSDAIQIGATDFVGVRLGLTRRTVPPTADETLIGPDPGGPEGLTQVQLADVLGRPQSFVSKYERGERRFDFVAVLEIAAALGADVGDLVSEVRRSS